MTDQQLITITMKTLCGLFAFMILAALILLVWSESKIKELENDQQ